MGVSGNKAIQLAAQDKAVIIIGGGVGPMAGVRLHAKIVEQTPTDGSDQSHLTVVHYSASCAIGDRTAYLVASQEERKKRINPAYAMAEVFDHAARALPEGRGRLAAFPAIRFTRRKFSVFFWRDWLKLAILSQSSTCLTLRWICLRNGCSCRREGLGKKSVFYQQQEQGKAAFSTLRWRMPVLRRSMSLPSCKQRCMKLFTIANGESRQSILLQPEQV